MTYQLGCSIIVLNYFGEKVIAETLNSLVNLNYPKDKYEIIIVDNNSKDRSKQIINGFVSKYENIKALYLKHNYGFSKGNNFGIKEATGEYVALLNNDCVVEKNWLKSLTETAKKDPRIFAVNSKILLYPGFLKVNIKNDKGIFLQEFFVENSNLSKFTKDGHLRVDLFIKKKDLYELAVPYDVRNDKNIDLTLTFTKSIYAKVSRDSLKEVINLNKNLYIVKEFENNSSLIKCTLRINLQTKIINNISYDKIQNAGIVVFQDGSGRDIGSVIRDNRQYYEIDFNQYDKEKEIYAACGAAVLYNTKILKRIGLLEESFFMYYEDVDISERARLQGYKIYYSPGAIVRHLHALSSKEWSGFFVYHAERGRLMHIFFNFPFKIFILEYILMIGKIFDVILRMIWKYKLFIKFLLGKGVKEQEQPNYKKSVQYIKIITFFMINIIPLLIKRLLRKFKLTKQAVEKNYKEILSGRWYFNNG